MNKTELAEEYFKNNPMLSSQEVADGCGVGGRTARRAMENVRKATPPPSRSGAKILLLDIETSPLEFFGWSLKQNGYIPHDHIIKEWGILSWATKWLYGSKISSAVVSHKDAKKRVDRSIIQEIWDLVDEADILVAHNLTGFDRKKLNARFIANGLYPTTSCQWVDTLQHSRKEFGFSSHKLDHLSRMFETSQKEKTEHSLWRRCVGKNGAGNDIADRKAALQEMLHYNKSDIFALEEIYLILLPWMRSHPNMGLYADSDVPLCTNCGFSGLTWKGHYYTPMGKYREFRCNRCHSPGRDRKADMPYDEDGKRKPLMAATAR